MNAWRILPGLLICSTPVAAAGVAICYNYGCAAEARVEFSEARLAAVRELLGAAPTPAQERAALAQAVGWLYTWAGEQSPIWRDRGEDYPDGDVDGRMDCIDHATSTTRLLTLLEQRGWLRHHRVLQSAQRTRLWFTQHFAAVVEETAVLNRTSEQPAERALFVIDSWFFDHGHPAVVMPLERWLSGAYPETGDQ